MRNSNSVLRLQFEDNDRLAVGPADEVPVLRRTEKAGQGVPGLHARPPVRVVRGGLRSPSGANFREHPRLNTVNTRGGGAHYRQLGVESLERFYGAGVFYGSTASEAPFVTGEEVYVVGGANSAGQAVLHLARYAKRVTLVVRAESLDVAMSHYLVRQIAATPNVDVRSGTDVVEGGGRGRLERLVLQDRATRERTTVNAQALFLMIGARPHTEWLPSTIERDSAGFVFTGRDLSQRARRALDRPPLDLETTSPACSPSETSGTAR